MCSGVLVLTLAWIGARAKKKVARRVVSFLIRLVHWLAATSGGVRVHFSAVNPFVVANFRVERFCGGLSG